jgi:hypothetical protein
MAVYLARALKLPDCNYSDFVDVEWGDWGFGAIAALRRARLIDAISPLTFSPGRPVSRQEAAALLVAVLRYSMENQGAEIADSLTRIASKSYWPASRTEGSSVPAMLPMSPSPTGWGCSTLPPKVGCSRRLVSLRTS